jgi:hypothetical protein
MTTSPGTLCASISSRGCSRQASWAPIGRTFPLEVIVDAHRFVESGRKLGNVALRVRTDDDAGAKE